MNKHISFWKTSTMLPDILAFFLILFTPYLNFIIYNDIVFEQANIIISACFLFCLLFFLH